MFIHNKKIVCSLFIMKGGMKVNRNSGYLFKNLLTQGDFFRIL